MSKKSPIMHHTDNMYVTPGTKMSDLIIGNPYIIFMLEHLGTGLEVHEKTVGQLCNEHKINDELFCLIANLFNGYDLSPELEYTSDIIQVTIGYLKNSHQYYLNEKYPQIKNYIKEINMLNDNPEIVMIGKFFDKYFSEVIEHLDYENNVVFPYVLKLDHLLEGKDCKDIESNYRVNDYREHHDDIEEKLADLNNLLIRYMPLKNDQKVRRQLLLCLFELEYDLKIHSQIEEILLIPLVEKMEKLCKMFR